LGAETHILVGKDIPTAILDYARSRNVTKIVVGKTSQPWWKRVLARTVAEIIVDASGDIDVYVITGEGEPSRPPASLNPPAWNWSHYLATALVVTLCGLVSWGIHAYAHSEANIVMVFLLGVVYVAGRYGRGPAIAASLAGVLTFDFFFVEPYLSFAVSDVKYVFTFAVMLAIGVIISALTARTRNQLRASQQIERRTAALFRLTRQMSEVSGSEFLIATAGKQLAEIFAGEVVIYTRDEQGPVSLRFGQGTNVARQEINGVVAQWVTDHDHIAGVGTDTLPNATALFVPLTGSQRTIGALGVRPADSERLNDQEQRRLLETCASLIALSIERDQSVLEASQVRH
jgi:two-component system sensor histidine kinase KdpD